MEPLVDLNSQDSPQTNKPKTSPQLAQNRALVRAKRKADQADKNKRETRERQVSVSRRKAPQSDLERLCLVRDSLEVVLRDKSITPSERATTARAYRDAIRDIAALGGQQEGQALRQETLGFIQWIKQKH